MVENRGKVMQTIKPERRIADMQDSYKCLGIPQASGNHDKDAKRSGTANYLQKVR